jgi:uncharacterized protein YndB with AHSA1/START domain
MTKPIVDTQMLIRRPAEEVFNAFIDPAVTTKFWFSKSNGRLEVGKRLRWEWEMYGVGGDVEAKAIEPYSRILVEWPEDGSTTEWRFEPRGPSATLVKIVYTGADSSGDALVAQATDNMQGYSLMLAGAKAWLEHGVEPRLVVDSRPDDLVKGWTRD